MNGSKLAALKAAFPHTLPILTGFTIFGLAYGIYMRVSGFNFIYSTLIGLTVFGGSLQFVMVPMLLAPFAPVSALAMALLVQARHLFYGLAMLEKYKDMGWKKYYLIFAMCDESFSVNCTAEIPEGVDRGWFYFFVSALNQCYWVTASTIGGILGSMITFDTKGLDFVMTAMFTVILTEQLLKENQYYSAIIGLVCSVGSLIIFGPNSFLLPTMISMLVLLTVCRSFISKKGGYEE